MSFLAPTVTANLSPSLLIGDSGEDAIELLCTAIVAEDVMSASYQFTWIKDDTPVDLSNDRIVVCIVVTIAKFVLYVHLHVQVTNNNNTSSFAIKATDTNATLDNGVYKCEVTLTISGVNTFNKSSSNYSMILYKGMLTSMLLQIKILFHNYVQYVRSYTFV